MASTGVLLLSNLVAGYLHLFDTNWLAKIVFNSWTGYGYLALVATLFLYYSYRIGRMLLRMRIARALQA